MEPVLVAAVGVVDHQPLATIVVPSPLGEDDNAPSLTIEEER